MSEYSDYYQRVGDKPNPMLMDALEMYPGVKGVALDLGAGSMRDAKMLLSRGFKRVVAVDTDAAAPSFVVEGIQLCVYPIENFNFAPESFDLVVSCNALYFLTKDQVKDVVMRAHRGMKQGGVFVANLLGPDDGWTSWCGAQSQFRREEIVDMAKPFKRCKVTEIRTSESAILGFKKLHHQWYIVLQK